MKKAHLLRCARPTRSNVPQRVRLRLARPEQVEGSVFARLASETFLIGLTGLLIGDIKRRKSILLFSLVVWAGAASAQTTKLKVAYPTTVGSMAVIWVAKDARLFEKHGLEVELIYVAGSSKVVQAMLAKEIPISEIAIPAVIQANLAGADLVMLAGPNHKPGQKIMVKPEIKTPENLKGKKIGISRFGTSDDFLLRYILGQWKIQPDRDVALLQMGGSPEILAGLGSRGIDGGMLASPLHLRAVKLGFSVLADLSTIDVDYQGAGVVTTRAYARENQDVVRRYLRAYVEGLHRFKTDKNFSLKVIGKYTRISEADALEETYQHYAVKVMPKVPYPTTKGIQMVLDEIGSRDAKAKNLSPAALIDVHYLNELEQSGFVKNLYGE
jgi:NitT/TauT family transport system substrate-binding protein